jgi:hypothetical protein
MILSLMRVSQEIVTVVGVLTVTHQGWFRFVGPMRPGRLAQ